MELIAARARLKELRELEEQTRVASYRYQGGIIEMEIIVKKLEAAENKDKK